MRGVRLPACAAAAVFAAIAQVPMPPPLVPPAPKPSAAKPANPGGRAGRGAAPSYKDLKYAAPRAPQPVAFKRYQLPNGLKLLLAENHEAPVVAGTAFVRTGSVFDPPGREGLATLTAALLRGGGSGQRTPDQLDTELDNLGAAIDTNVTETLATVSFSTLKRAAAPTLAMFRDVLTAPAFRSERVDLGKGGLFNLIARRNDDPRQVLIREFLRSVYGKDSPVVRRPEYGTVMPIQRTDVERFYRRYFFPANTTLMVAGDFDAETMRGALEALFTDWKAVQPAAPEFPAVTGGAGGGAFLASKPDARQSHFAFGRIGATFRDPDAAALDMATTILAIGPSSRVARRHTAAEQSIQELRAESLPGLFLPGASLVLGVTMTGATEETVAMAMDELQKLRAAEPTEEEVRVARELVWNRVSAGLDKASRAATMAATAEYYGYPADYLQQYLKSVAAVTKADVWRVAKERLDPATFTLTVVSRLRALTDPRGGAALPIDLTIPPRPQVSAPTASGTAEEGRKLLARAQQAVGGAEKLAAVKDLTMHTSYKLARGGTDEETDQWVAPSTLRQDGTSPLFGRLIRYTDGKGGWMSNGFGSGPLLGTTLTQVMGELMRSPISLLLSDRVPGRVVTGVDDRTIEIVQGANIVRVVFDPATGLPAELHYDIPSDRGPLTLIQETLSDYRDVSGIKLPFRTAVLQNGAKYAEGEVTEITLNQGLKAEVLQKRP
jgi:zinc protease